MVCIFARQALIKPDLISLAGMIRALVMRAAPSQHGHRSFIRASFTRSFYYCCVLLWAANEAGGSAFLSCCPACNLNHRTATHLLFTNGRSDGAGTTVINMIEAASYAYRNGMVYGGAISCRYRVKHHVRIDKAVALMMGTANVLVENNDVADGGLKDALSTTLTPWLQLSRNEAHAIVNNSSWRGSPSMGSGNLPLVRPTLPFRAILREHVQRAVAAALSSHGGFTVLRSATSTDNMAAPRAVSTESRSSNDIAAAVANLIVTPVRVSLADHPRPSWFPPVFVTALRSGVACRNAPPSALQLSSLSAPSVSPSAPVIGKVLVAIHVRRGDVNTRDHLRFDSDNAYLRLINVLRRAIEDENEEEEKGEHNSVPLQLDAHIFSSTADGAWTKGHGGLEEDSDSFSRFRAARGVTAVHLDECDVLRCAWPSFVTYPPRPEDIDNPIILGTSEKVPRAFDLLVAARSAFSAVAAPYRMPAAPDGDRLHCATLSIADMVVRGYPGGRGSAGKFGDDDDDEDGNNKFQNNHDKYGDSSDDIDIDDALYHAMMNFSISGSRSEGAKQRPLRLRTCINELKATARERAPAMWAEEEKKKTTQTLYACPDFCATNTSKMLRHLAVSTLDMIHEKERKEGHRGDRKKKYVHHC